MTVLLFLSHNACMSDSKIIETIKGKYIDVSDFLKREPIGSNYHRAQGQAEVYRAALERPSGVVKELVETMLEENIITLSELSKKIEIEKQQGRVEAIEYVINLLEFNK